MKGVIDMLLYSDGVLGSKPITPAHRYVYQSEWAKILEDIEKGEVPCGSGQPFPVEWADPKDAPSERDANWGASNATYNGGGIGNIFQGFQFGSMT